MSKIITAILLSFFLFEELNAFPDYRIFTENGKQGLMNETGKVVIPAQFESLGWSFSIGEVRNNRIGFKKDGMWGVVSVDNKILYPAILEAVYDATPSFIIYGKKQISGRYKKGLMDYEGKTLIEPLYNDLQLHDTYIAVNQAEKWGLLNLEGKAILPIQYSRLKKVHEFRWLAMNHQNKGALFNSNGGQLSEFMLDDLQSFNKNVAIASVGNYQGLLNNNGDWILKPEFKNISLSGHQAVGEYFKEFYKFGHPEKSWKIDSMKVKKHHFILYAAGNSVVLNYNGDTVLNEDGLVENFLGDFLLINNNGEYGLYDIKKNGYVLQPGYKSAELLNEAIAITNGKDGYTFFSLPSGQKKLGAVDKFYKEGPHLFYMRRGFWGVLDETGKEILPPVYDQIWNHKKGLFIVKFHSAYGLVDKNENWILSPQKDSIVDANDKIYITYSGDLFNIYSNHGSRLYFTPFPLTLQKNYVEEQRNGSTILIDFEGISFPRPKSGDIQVFGESEGFTGIKRDGRFGFIDNQGRLRIANRYEGIRPFHEGIAAVKIRGSWGAINKAERLIVQPLYNSISTFSNGTAIVEQKNKYGLINATGDVILNIEYDEIRRDGVYYAIKKNQKSGVANSGGFMIIWPKYDQVIQAKNHFIVLNDDKKGLFDKEGIAVLPPVYDDIIPIPFSEAIFIGKKKKNVAVALN